MFEIEKLVRPRILKMKPYSSARDEFAGQARVYLDANENPYGSILADQPYHRYPHPLQPELKTAISQFLHVPTDCIFLGNGSDEAIDLLLRVFCEPNQDEIMTLPATYGMYAVSAEINSVAVREVPLTVDFQLDVPAILAQIQPQTKIIFICSPNNPTGNSLHAQDVLAILQNFQGIVVIDEAYIDFSSQPSWVGKLQDFPRLVILRTFSKAWGMAALRIGMALASPAIIALLNKIKAPYNLNVLVQAHLLEAIQHRDAWQARVRSIIAERERLTQKLLQNPAVDTLFPSDANFILVRFRTDAKAIYQQLLERGIVVRDRSSQKGCRNCLRLTVGTPAENDDLLALFQIAIA